MIARIKNTILNLYTLTFIVCALLIASDAFAQEGRVTQMMTTLPGLGIENTRTLPEYINALYILLISIGAIFGTLKIAFAGVKWATSSNPGAISSAKKDIQGVLLGLILLMLPFIVLKAINPDLIKLDVLSLTPLEIEDSQSQTAPDTSSRTYDSAGREIIRSENTVKCAEYDSDQSSAIRSRMRDLWGSFSDFVRWCEQSGGKSLPRQGQERYEDCLFPTGAICPALPSSSNQSTGSNKCGSCSVNNTATRNGLTQCQALESVCDQINGEMMSASQGTIRECWVQGACPSPLPSP